MDCQCEISKMSQMEINSLVAAAAVLLHQRNKFLSSIQHTVGLLFDFGGLLDKTITAIKNLGFSVGPSSISGKRKNLNYITVI